MIANPIFLTEKDEEREISVMQEFSLRFLVGFSKRAKHDSADFDLLDGDTLVGFAEVRTKRERLHDRSWSYLDEPKFISLRKLSDSRRLPVFYLLGAYDGIFSLAIHKLNVDGMTVDFVGRIHDSGADDRKRAFRVPARFWIRFSNANIWDVG